MSNAAIKCSFLLTTLSFQLDLHDANKKLQSSHQNNVPKTDDTQRKQIEAQLKHVEEAKTKLENDRKVFDEQR